MSRAARARRDRRWQRYIRRYPTAAPPPGEHRAWMAVVRHRMARR